MHTRVQQRVLYSESAQVRLGEGRGRFDDKKIRVGPAYQAVIPVLGSCSRVDETARAGVEMARTKQTASFRRHWRICSRRRGLLTSRGELWF